MSKIVSIVPRPTKWLVGHSEEKLIREPFGTEMMTITVQCIPDGAKSPLYEGGNSAIIALSCGHNLEWERPTTVACYQSLEEWAQSLQGRVGRRVRCRKCTEL